MPHRHLDRTQCASPKGLARTTGRRGGIRTPNVTLREQIYSLSQNHRLCSPPKNLRERLRTFTPPFTMPTLKHEVFPRIALHYTKYDQSTLTGHIKINSLRSVAESNCSWPFDAYSTLRRLGLPVLPLHHTPHNLNSSPFVYRGDRRPSTGTHKR